MKQSDINRMDIKQIKSILEEHCNVLLHHSSKINNGFINSIALSKKYNKPLITWIMDIYHRCLINHWIETNGKILLPIQFIENYLFMKHLSDRSELSVYNSFKSVIMTFHRTIGSFPEIGSSVFKYNDNLMEYIQTTNTINKVIKNTAV